MNAQSRRRDSRLNVQASEDADGGMETDQGGESPIFPVGASVVGLDLKWGNQPEINKNLMVV